ncbi:MAG TPA: hypothetical protein VLX56_05995 [Nitrososphaerales archaeon]|nr:hypothetical protein [Nitrososphaerales archaeon]
MPAQGRLHYLYEAAEEGEKERFVYFCSGCSCILHVSASLEPVARTVESLENRCPGCGSELESGVSCRSARVPESWPEVTRSSLSARAAPARREAEFKTAASMRGFSFNFGPLDALVGHYIDQAWSVAFTGARANAVGEFLCFRGQLPREQGGRDSAVVLIDGGNRSDLYLFSAFAKLYGVQPKKALRRVVTSRAFTPYQLVDLVTRELPRVVEEYGARMVVLTDVFGVMGEGSEVDEDEGRRLALAVRRGIEEVKGKGVLVFETLITRTSFDGAVTDHADVLVGLEEERGRIRGTLQRHPFVKRSAPREFTLRDLLFHNRAEAKEPEG